MKNIAKKIKQYNKIIILRHSRPDLDAISSQYAMYRGIKHKYPNKEVYMAGDDPKSFSFICKMDEVPSSIYQDALSIVLDCSEAHMVGSDEFLNSKEIVVMDHHQNTSDITSAYVYKDTSKIACAQIVYEFLTKNHFEIDKKMATSLYGGIVTDSGRFMYNVGDAKSFMVASKLVELGADMKFIYDNLYKESLDEKIMRADFVLKIKTNGPVAYMINDKDVYQKYPNASSFDISRGLVNLMSGIEKIEAWANFTVDKDSDKIFVELRSKNISIVDIVYKYGGGGHAQACGCTIDSFDKVNEIIELLKEKLQNGTNV